MEVEQPASVTSRVAGDLESERPLVSVALTQEELRLVSILVGSEGLPGLESLEGAPSDKQIADVLYGQRSLQARELAAIADDGSLAVHDVLLTMVGTAAYPEQS